MTGERAKQVVRARARDEIETEIATEIVTEIATETDGRRKKKRRLGIEVEAVQTPKGRKKVRKRRRTGTKTKAKIRTEDAIRSEVVHRPTAAHAASLGDADVAKAGQAVEAPPGL
mmetsp:Transcript_19131/g.35615  ORF Transcript_19131/g.35615 Transcript_19131/m.35615 type:complete len:115 (+) Transcript_19131:495-839(+)